MSEEKRKPVGKLKMWPLSAAIWPSEHEGRIFYNVTFQRSYKKEDGEYGNAESIGRDDLLTLAKLADRAHSAVLLLEKKDRQEAQSRLGTRRRGAPASAGAPAGTPATPEGPDDDDVPF